MKSLVMKDKKPIVSKHMQSFGERYDPRTKILTTQKGQKLKKYAHGYFAMSKLNRKRLTSTVKKFLQSYPQWIIEEKSISTDDFQYCFATMVQAHPLMMSIFQKQGQSQTILFKTIDHIRFAYLKQIEIHLEQSTSLEPLGWLQAPNLQSIYVSSLSVFSSINTLAKTNFQNLKIIKLEINDDKISYKRHYDLSRISRMRMLNNNRTQKNIFILSQGSINLFQREGSDLYYLAKMQMERLKNFRIPLIQPKFGEKTLNLRKTVKALNQKFNNTTRYYELFSNQSQIFMDDIYQLSVLNSSNSDSSDYYYNDSDEEVNYYWMNDEGYDSDTHGYSHHYDNWYDD